jgi:hypothetical protein
MNTLTAHWLVCLVGLSAASGCAASSDRVDESEQKVGTPCPPFRCTNSPEVILHGMHEANLLGQRNAQSLALETTEGGRAAIFVNGVAHDLVFKDGRMFAEGPSGTRSGDELLHAELHMRDLDGPAFNIKIERIREINMKLEPFELVEVYKLSWYKPDTEPLLLGKNVCNGPMGSFPYDGDELLGMLPDETLLFTGDRVDSDQLLMVRDDSNEWLNFGCAGHTLAKLFLTRSTTASAWHRIPDERGNQAMLKMLTGDYCGVGRGMTITGTQVRWRNRHLDFAISPSGIEAKWSNEGAVCVSKMRLEANPSIHFPDPRKALEQTCNLEECSDDPETWKPTEDVLVVSGNP